MRKKKAARRSGNYDTRQGAHSRRDTDILHEYDRATLIAGIIIAISFGMMILHWAVVG